MRLFTTLGEVRNGAVGLTVSLSVAILSPSCHAAPYGEGQLELNLLHAQQALANGLPDVAELELNDCLANGKQRAGRSGSQAVASATRGLCSIYIRRGDYKSAENLALKGLNWLSTKAIDSRPAIASMHGTLAQVFAAQHKSVQALSEFDTALKLYREQDDASSIAQTLAQMAQVEITDNDLENAERHLSEALNLEPDRQGSPNLRAAPILESLAEVKTKKKDYVSARELLQRALNIYRSYPLLTSRLPECQKKYDDLLEYLRGRNVL